MHRSIFLASFQLTLVIALVGCDDPAAPTRPDPDKARECGPAGFDAGTDDGQTPGCAAGELCIEGRCYAACGGDAECGPRETCSSSGACVPATSGDAGMASDGGLPDPCALIACADLSVCHPLSGTCVQCNEDTIGAAEGAPGHCADVCDIARGECVSAMPAQCAPCAVDEDCVADDGFMGRCVSRTVQDVRERVCVVDCGSGRSCPGGLVCDESLNVCVPPLEVPCTSWLAGVRGQFCFSDAECGALGAVEAVYMGSCDGVEEATEDGGAAEPGACLRPCNDVAHCAAEQECLGSPPFCRAPSP